MSVGGLKGWLLAPPWYVQLAVVGVGILVAVAVARQHAREDWQLDATTQLEMQLVAGRVTAIATLAFAVVDVVGSNPVALGASVVVGYFAPGVAGAALSLSEWPAGTPQRLAVAWGLIAALGVAGRLVAGQHAAAAGLWAVVVIAGGAVLYDLAVIGRDDLSIAG